MYVMFKQEKNSSAVFDEHGNPTSGDRNLAIKSTFTLPFSVLCSSAASGNCCKCRQNCDTLSDTSLLSAAFDFPWVRSNRLEREAEKVEVKNMA
ncbi:hypothetical protein ACS0TY_020613 [Phlomoides rotata]